MKVPWSVERRVAIGLHPFGRGTTYKVTGERFEVRNFTALGIMCY